MTTDLAVMLFSITHELYFAELTLAKLSHLVKYDFCFLCKMPKISESYFTSHQAVPSCISNCGLL